MTPDHGQPPARQRPPRRWLRLLIPVSLAATLIAWTVLAHLIAEPSRTDSDYLNPASTNGIGAHTLAEQLTGQGIRIQVAHTGTAAVELATAGDTTLLLPAADLMLPSAVIRLQQLPPTVTVVLVRPGPLTLAEVAAPFDRATPRWATRSAAGCVPPAALPTSAALVYHDHYRPWDESTGGVPDGYAITRDCFEHALVGFRGPGQPEFVLLGADEIARNDRIHSSGNAALARALLSGHQSLVWLDLHHRERPPPGHHGPAPKDSGSGPSLPLPSWVKATAVGLLIAAVIAALAAGRRLGGPVREPLPVRVRATETTIGRGRLYRRARARGVALSRLRDHAIGRLRSALDLPGAPPAALVAVVADRIGAAPEGVHPVLFGPEPDDDEALVAAVAHLDALLAAALPDPRTGPDGATTNAPGPDGAHPNGTITRDLSTKEWS